MTPEQEKLVVSKQRVADHGEVYTGKREVNAMLDLVKQETERIESKFLEPACGTGNFLVEILERKLEVVIKRYKKSQVDFELLVSLGVFNGPLMNDAVFKFKRYEDASLSYTGIDKHEGEDIGGFDTTITAEEHQAMAVFENQAENGG